MKYKTWIFLQLLVMVICCSCGVTAMQAESFRDLPEADVMAATNSAMTATKSAVTKSAVFMNSETSVKEKRLENDFIRIWNDKHNGEHRNAWMQENLDGTDRKEINISGKDEEEYLFEVEWLTNDWIYYTIIWLTNERDDEAVYRAPLEYHAGKVMINESKREKLFQENCVRDFMVTDSYVFYSVFVGKKNEQNYYRYDLATGKKEKVFSFQWDSKSDWGDDSEIICTYDGNSCNYDLPVVTEKSFFLWEENKRKESLYRVSLETLEREKIADISTSGELLALEQDGIIYFLQARTTKEDELLIEEADSVWQYNEGQEEITPVLDSETFRKIILSLNLWGEEAIKVRGEIEEMYIDGSKMYLQVDIYWNQKELAEDGKLEGEMIEREYRRSVLLSADFPALSDWKLEEGLADYFQKHIDHETNFGEWGYSCTEEVTIEEVKDDQVQFSFYEEEERNSVKEIIALYDLATGEVKRLPETDYRYMQ